MFKKLRKAGQVSESKNRKFLESPMARVEMMLGDSTLAKLNGTANSYTNLSKVGEELNAKEFEKIDTAQNRSSQHWFSPDQPLVRGKVMNGKNSDSWFRLEAFIKSHDEEELRKIDPSYGRPL